MQSYIFPKSFQSTDDDLIIHCLFCCAGFEVKIADAINERYDEILALPVLQEKHSSKNGVRTMIQHTMIPGYIFVYSKTAIPMKWIRMDRKIIRFLKDTDETYQLNGENLEYARWVLKYKGLIEHSKAMNINGKVQVVSGPLKDYEGKIMEISKKNRNCRVEIQFMNQALKIWLPFEWVEQDNS